MSETLQELLEQARAAVDLSWLTPAHITPGTPQFEATRLYVIGELAHEMFAAFKADRAGDLLGYALHSLAAVAWSRVLVKLAPPEAPGPIRD